MYVCLSPFFNNDLHPLNLTILFSFALQVPYKSDNNRQAESSFSDVYSEVALQSEGENEQHYQVKEMLVLLFSSNIPLCYMIYSTGLEIATNAVAFATKFVPFATKISREVTNLRLIFTSALSKQKDYQLPICCYFNKVKKEITKLFCFLQ